MFDISFFEMFVIALIALLVVGPERLPKVARTLGHLWGRAQRYVNGIKADMTRDLALDELRELKQKVQEQAQSTKSALNLVSSELTQQVDQLNTSIAQTAQTVAQEIQEPEKSPAPESQIPEQQKLPIN